MYKLLSVFLTDERLKSLAQYRTAQTTVTLIAAAAAVVVFTLSDSVKLCGIALAFCCIAQLAGWGAAFIFHITAGRLAERETEQPHPPAEAEARAQLSRGGKACAAEVRGILMSALLTTAILLPVSIAAALMMLSPNRALTVTGWIAAWVGFAAGVIQSVRCVLRVSFRWTKLETALSGEIALLAGAAPDAIRIRGIAAEARYLFIRRTDYEYYVRLSRHQLIALAVGAIPVGLLVMLSQSLHSGRLGVLSIVSVLIPNGIWLFYSMRKRSMLLRLSRLMPSDTPEADARMHVIAGYIVYRDRYGGTAPLGALIGVAVIALGAVFFRLCGLPRLTLIAVVAGIAVAVGLGLVHLRAYKRMRLRAAPYERKIEAVGFFPGDSARGIYDIEDAYEEEKDEDDERDEGDDANDEGDGDAYDEGDGEVFFKLYDEDEEEKEKYHLVIEDDDTLPF